MAVFLTRATCDPISRHIADLVVCCAFPALLFLGYTKKASLRMTDGCLWFDERDAEDRIERADVPAECKRVTRELRDFGISVLPGRVDPQLCRSVIDDYDRYVGERPLYVDQWRDELGREKRLVNFHHYSDAAMRIGTHPDLMSILDFVFGSEVGPYTSLTFKYGTQQPVHRDTPHFATWPRERFCGVWTALEDVADEAGPLLYHPRGHRFPVDQAAIWDRVQASSPVGRPLDESLASALDIYNGEVIERARVLTPAVQLPLKCGDVAIWHPELPHGGCPAANPFRSRWSVVFHCAPIDTQVFQHPQFFQHRGLMAPPPRYGFRTHYGRQVAVAGETAFM